MHWFFWSLLSAVFAAITAVFAKAGLDNVNSHVATAVRTTVVLVFASGLVLATGNAGNVLQLTKRHWLLLTCSGLATGVSWICYFRALQEGEASRVVPVDRLSVVFVMLFSALWLGESVTLKSFVGAILVTVGAVILAFK